MTLTRHVGYLYPDDESEELIYLFQRLMASVTEIRNGNLSELRDQGRVLKITVEIVEDPND